LLKKLVNILKHDCKAQIEADLLSSAMNLVMKGYMEISIFERDKSKVNLDKPTLSNLALYQVNNTSSTWVTGFNHAPVGINIFDRFALKYMDGKNTKKQILDNLAHKKLLMVSLL
jgi:methyltransferase-like protein